jgi:hypothetical protein
MIIIDNFIKKLFQQMLEYDSEKYDGSKYIMVLEILLIFKVKIQLISIPLKIFAF